MLKTLCQALTPPPCEITFETTETLDCIVRADVLLFMHTRETLFTSIQIWDWLTSCKTQRIWKATRLGLVFLRQMTVTVIVIMTL